MALLYKDIALDQLAEVANVAQFVSFGPDLRQRYARVRGHPPNHRFPSLEAAAGALLEAAPDAAVNVRSFAEEDSKGRDFLYGLKERDEVVATVRRLAALQLYTIVNETIDIYDGGVS